MYAPAAFSAIEVVRAHGAGQLRAQCEKLHDLSLTELGLWLVKQMECHLRCEREVVDLLEDLDGLCWAWAR